MAYEAPRLGRPPKERFWEKVDKTSGQNDCWLWLGSKDRKGYGKFWMDGKVRTAHRVAYAWAKGEILDGIDLDHTCQIPQCVNPEHLVPVSASLNSRLRWERESKPLLAVPTLGANAKRRTPAERLWEKVDKQGPEDCWLWLASFQGPYPSFSVNRKSVLAHRFSWELHNGPIKPGYTIDHLCRNPACVNPVHLDEVTMGENTRRQPRYQSDTCQKGHKWTAENTYVDPNSLRHCRECTRAGERKRRQTEPYKAVLREQQRRRRRREGMQEREYNPDFYPCGHDRTESNTKRRPNGSTICRECDIARARNWYSRNKGNALA